MKADLKTTINNIKKEIELPVAVGFGVSKPEQVKDLISQGADGIIVGSALIKKISAGEDYISFVSSLKEETK
jgi:tryptophan synthase alpha chain